MDEKPVSNVLVEVGLAVAALLIAVALFGVYIEGILDFYRKVVDWTSQHGRTIRMILGPIFVVLSILLAGFSVVMIQKIFAIKKHVFETQNLTPHVSTPAEETSASWKNIQKLISSENASDWNMAIIRADALLDDMLQHLGYEGDTMADRLKIVDPSRLPSKDRVWAAHRLRNSIAHDPTITHARENIEYAIRSYEAALRELDVLHIETT